MHGFAVTRRLPRIKAVAETATCGFALEGLLAGFADFPNLGSGQLEDCLLYALDATAGNKPST